MEVELVRPHELSCEDVGRWHRLRAEAGLVDNAFLSPDFAMAAGAVRSAARVAILRDAGEVVGYFAHERHLRGILRPIAAGLSDYQALIARCDLDLDLTALMRACGGVTWEFDHLAGPQAAFLRTSDRSRFWTQYSPTVDLSDGFDAYVASRRQSSKKLMQDTERKRRKLGREVGPIRFTTAVADDGNLEQLMRWKSRQYRATGRRDRFASDSNRRLLAHLLQSSTPRMRADLHVLKAGDRAVAWHLGLRTPSLMSYWFPSFDRRFAAYSPGLVLILELARVLAEEGCEVLDLGRGDESYKQRLSNGNLPVLQGYVDRTASAAVVLGMHRRPRDAAMALVLGSPRLRLAARHALAQAGSLRTRLQRRTSEEPDQRSRHASPSD